jgi:hypothetical protein
MAHELDSVNITELIQMCRDSGMGNFGRTASRAELCDALENNEPPASEDPLEERRVLMEQHIKKNYRRLRTQLPGCTGKCVSYGCPDLIVQRCWVGFRDDMI